MWRDRPVLEITPAMVEAGAWALRMASVGGEPCDGGEGVVEDVLLAALRASEVFQFWELHLEGDAGDPAQGQEGRTVMIDPTKPFAGTANELNALLSAAQAAPAETAR